MLYDGFFKLTMGAAVLVVLATLLWLGTPAFPLDDAYIVQHAVANLSKDIDPRFPEVTPLHGTTSPFHVLLVLLTGKIMSLDWAQFMVTAAFYLAFVAGVYRLARVEGLSGGLAMALAALATISGVSYYQFFNGLETSVAMAAVTWVLILFRDPLPDRNRHAALLGVLPFIRPELAVLSFLFGARIVWSLWRSRVQKKERALALFGWLCVGAFVPASFVFLANGPIIPNTISAKAYFFAEGCQPLLGKVSFVASIILQFFSYLGIGWMGFLGLAVTRHRYLALGFLVAFLSAYVIFLPGALHHNDFRYLHVFVPFMILGWAGLLSSSRESVRVATRMVLVIAILYSAVLVPKVVQRYADDIEFTRKERDGVARWVEENLDPDDAILIHDAGYISLHGTQPLVDLVGLKTPRSVQVHRELTWETCSRNPRALEGIVRENDARFFIVYSVWDEIFDLVASLEARDWRVDRVDAERGDTEYKVYRLTRE